MSTHTRMTCQSYLDESDLRLIEAEIDRICTDEPLVPGVPQTAPKATYPASHGALADAFAVRPTFEWSSAMSHRTRNLEDLRAWTFANLSNNGSPINSTDLLAKHINARGSVGEINGMVDDFVTRLNRVSTFAADGLSLMPGDLPSNPTVNHLLKAIVTDYERRDIEVIL